MLATLSLLILDRKEIYSTVFQCLTDCYHTDRMTHVDEDGDAFATPLSSPLASPPSHSPPQSPPPTPPLQVVFSFDTTDSMMFHLDEVRRRLKSMTDRLFTDIPGLEVAVIAHGDYDDDPYVTRRLDFKRSDQTHEITAFINGVEGSHSKDFAECYELVLHEVRRELSWRDDGGGGGRRILVMIGDAVPHEVGEERNIHHLDWREEASKLHYNMGVQIYTVQCVMGLGSEKTTDFWKTLAEIGGGKHLTLTDAESIVEFLIAICLHMQAEEDKMKNYESDLRASLGSSMKRDVSRMFASFNKAAEHAKEDIDPSSWSNFGEVDFSIALPPLTGMRAFGNEPSDSLNSHTAPRPKLHIEESIVTDIPLPSPASTPSLHMSPPTSSTSSLYALNSKSLRDDAWRRVPWSWTEEECARKRRSIIKLCRPEEIFPGVKSYNVLMCGMISSGKSSVINTLSAAMRGEYVQLATNQEAEHSVTRKYRMYRLRSAPAGVRDSAMPVNLCDTMGFEDIETKLVGPCLRDMDYIMDGRIKNDYEFRPNEPINFKDKLFVEDPAPEHKIHLLVIVMDGQMVTQMAPVAMVRLKEMVELANKKDIRVATLLTKVDKVCTHVDKDLSLVHHSENILDMVETAQAKIGCIKANIFPIKNYVDDFCQNLPINLLALDALEKIIHLAMNALESQATLKCVLPADEPTIAVPKLRATPWRNDDDLLPENIADFVKEMFDDFVDSKPASTINLAFFGPSGAGKSAFINSAISEMYGRIMTDAETGHEELTTRKFQMYKLRHGRHGEHLNITLADTMGFMENVPIRKHDVHLILDGMAQHNTTFNPDNDMTPGSKYRKSPIHAVAICVDAANFANLDSFSMDKIKEIVNEVKTRKLGCVVLVSHVDMICQHVHRDPSVVYSSNPVKEVFDLVFGRLGGKVPMVDILPLVNYCNHDAETCHSKSALILQALRHLVERAEDYT